MSYNYNEEKPKVMTPDGQKMLFSIRRQMERLIKLAGVVTLAKAIERVSGDSWTMIACVDYLVELGEFKEVELKSEHAAQERIFTDRE